MDRLTELFAHKPMSYPGEGIVFNGDARGNGVSSTVQDVQVVPRFMQGDTAAGDFAGNWKPTNGGSLTALNVGGGTIFDGATTHIVAAASLTVHASSLNYIYLECDLTPTLTDGFVTGGTVDATPTITSYTSAQTNTNSKAYILLCTWQAGALVTRYKWFSFGCELTNSGTGDTVFHSYP